MTMTFKVDGQPLGKARPKFNMTTGRVYTPTTTKNYEKYVRQNYAIQCKSYSFGNRPISVSIEAYVSPLAKFNKTQRKEALEGKLLPTSKPDADNIIKIVLDALIGIAF